MHQRDSFTEVLTQAIIRYAVERTHLDPPLLDRPRKREELQAMVGTTITESGIGALEALRVFADVLAPACISVDHPRFLSFIPAAPTEASILFDLVVGASSIYAGSWLEGAGAIFAENQALRWLADLAGLPETAGGVFVSGGTAGNLSALVAARARWRETGEGRRDLMRGLIVTSGGAHSSVEAAARVMDAHVTTVPTDERGRMNGAAITKTIDALSAEDRERIFAIVATSGTTNAGVIDDLAGTADVAAAHSTWFHVDGAYGAAALVAPSVRDRFAGIERADSFIVDPHKWLFAPFDCCALVYRDPLHARSAHTQRAEYLEILHGDTPEWNPSDFAHHLSRRARGLPFWFSLAAHGTTAYRDAVEATLTLTTEAARKIENTGHVELLLEPELSVVVFRRTGWTPDDYERWSDQALTDGLAFVTPTAWAGETVLRFCFVNPLTTIEDVRLILESMR
jgi:glutamate/tyrosine decarboxylase-like PLP-dependent enzyme